MHRADRVSALVAICATLASAQFNRYSWSLMNGIESGPITSIAAGGGALIAATQRHNLFRSLDSGRSWRPFPVGSGLLAEIHYAPRGNAFYAILDSGLYSTSPRGDAWKKIRALDPGYPALNGNLFSADGKALILRASGIGLFDMSLDSGKTWKAANGSTLGINPLAVVADGSCFYESDMDSPVMISCDQGKTWRKCAGDTLTNYGYSLVQGSGSVIIAAGRGLFQTPDQGKTLKPWGGVMNRQDRVWKLVAAEDSYFAWAYDPNGFNRSTDAGATWKLLPFKNAYYPLESPVGIAQIGNTLFAAAAKGVQVSRDGGLSWSVLEFGLMHSPVMALGAHGPLFLALTAQGVFVSADSGGTWENPIPSDDKRRWIALAGAGTLFAAGSTQGNVLVTRDMGVTWSGEMALPSAAPVLSLAALGGGLFAAQPGGLRFSPDSGRTWTTLALPGGEPPRRIAAGRGTLLIATDTRILERSPSGTYTELGGGSAPLPSLGLWSIDGRHFAAGEDGVLRRWDAAAGWAPRPEVNGHIFGVAGSGKTVLAVTSVAKYVSVDGGSTWTSLPDGTLGEEIRALAMDGRTLYGGDGRGGFWKYAMEFPEPPVGMARAGRTRSDRNLSPAKTRAWKGRDAAGRRRGALPPSGPTP